MFADMNQSSAYHLETWRFDESAIRRRPSYLSVNTSHVVGVSSAISANGRCENLQEKKREVSYSRTFVRQKEILTM